MNLEKEVFIGYNLIMYLAGQIDLPLHNGKAPFWLLSRMEKLGGCILEALVYEFDEDFVLEKLSNPLWFQSLGCLLGFDWHSSGLTTTLTYALKSGAKKRSLPLFVAGGKGKYSLKTPQEIKETAEKKGFEPESLIRTSRISAKVDNSCLQDGYTLYHHTLFFTSSGKWAVIQQGMDVKDKLARRYHWIYKVKSLVLSPHKGIITHRKTKPLNLIDAKRKEVQNRMVELARMSPDKLMKMPVRHRITTLDINPERLKSILLKSYEKQPENFEQLIGIRGIGPKTLRALALTAELLYGTPVSHHDPARFSFAHGGKDGTPYPVHRENYDRTISVFENAVVRAKLGKRETLIALRRLRGLFG